MVLLVVFLFGALLLGTGAMFSPALPTPQPRIALAGALVLALIIGGAVFWAYLFGWDTLVVDYMLFALVVGVLLRGTLSNGQARAEERGEVLHDSEQGWTGPEDLLFFAAVALLVVISAALRGDTFAQNTLVAQAASKVQTTHQLVTFTPVDGATFLSLDRIPPGFSAISVYFSQQLNLPVSTVQMGIGAVITFLLVWMVYDFGGEMRDKTLGRAMTAALLLGTGIVNTYFAGQFDALVGILFALAFIIFAERSRRSGEWRDLIAGGLMLGAIQFIHHPLFLMMAVGYALWLGVLALSAQRPSLKHYLGLIIGIGGMCATATAPYWLTASFSSDLLTITGSAESLPLRVFELGLFYGLPLIAMSGLGVYAIRQQSTSTHTAGSTLQPILSHLVLLVLVAVGIIAISGLDMRYAPLLIIPLTLLGGFGLDYLWMTYAAKPFVALPMMNRRFVGIGMVILGLLAVALNTALFLV